MNEMLNGSILQDKNGKRLQITDQTARDQAAENAERIGKLSEEMAKKREKPLVYIDGIIPTTKDNVNAEMRVVSSWLNFHAYIKIKCQGTSSMAYPKKNFTVKLYQDSERTIPLYITIPGWKTASNKFVLKANYIDHLHLRNIVTARLAAEIMASRPDYDTLPEELRNSPNNGAVDGFPIVVYNNGIYQGLYTWNIGKDPWLWGMDENNPNHVLLCAETNDDGLTERIENPCNFSSLWSGVHEEYWSVEVGTNSEAVKNALNALISCVKDTTDDEFRAQISNYLDVQSAIDYYILAYADCGIDNLAKNMLLGAFDLKKWYTGPYDLDSTWGLYWDGSKFLPATTACPGGYQAKYSLLWEKVVRVFKWEMKERKTELRKTVLSDANILSHFERAATEIGADAYADDLIPYPNIPSSDTNNIWQIRNFIPARMAFFDSWLSSINSDEPLYELPNPTVFATTADAIKTGVNIWAGDPDFTIMADMTPAETQSETNPTVFGCHSKTDPWAGISLQLKDNSDKYVINTITHYPLNTETSIPKGTTERCILVIRHASGSSIYKVYENVAGAETTRVIYMPFNVNVSTYAQGLGIGAADISYDDPKRPWNGTMNRFKVYQRYLPDEELAAFVAGANG